MRFRILAGCCALVALLSGCGGSHAQARAAAHDDLQAIIAVPTSGVRNGASGAPLTGIVVSGEITNNDTQTIRCGNASFVLMHGTNAILPSKTWCAAPALDAGQTAAFSLTFAAPGGGDLTLQLTHPDGSYERHDLAIPR